MLRSVATPAHCCTWNVYVSAVRSMRPLSIHEAPSDRGVQGVFPPAPNLIANLTAAVFGTKHDIDNPGTALKTTKGPLKCPKTERTLVHKRRKRGLYMITMAAA